ncbi:MAG: carboxypeptidase regulatory-like domain-containing protein [Acidobacteriaceae bacterium]
MHSCKSLLFNLRYSWLLLICCLGTTAVYGQVDQGAITGIVQDTQKSVIVGATVTLVNNETNLTLSRQTGGSGAYVFAPIKIGNYSVTVAAPGFAPVVRTDIRVDVSQTVGLNFTLKPGNASQTVTVTAETQLQTEQASTGQVFSAKVINDMPLPDRNYVFAAQLTTGVAPPNQGFRQVAGAGDFTSNGNRVSQNDFILDGVDNNSNMQDFLNGATYAVRPPPDALAEFKVESSDYSAELGHSTGAAVNASIKSGTNQFHGSLWEYFRNDRMAAIDYFNSSRTAYHLNQFGATIGGPFWKNKLFFFGDSQGTRISSYVPAQPNNTVPTAAIRTGDFSEMLDPANTSGNGSIALYQAGGNPTATIGGTDAPGFPPRYLTCNGVQNIICPTQVNAVAQGILNLFPLPNQGGPHQVFANYTVPATATTNNTTQYDARLDYNFSSKDQMFGRYSYSNNPTTFTPPLGVLDGGSFGSDGQNSNYAKSGVFSETHFFSPTLSNEFRLGFNWLLAAYLQPDSATNIAAKYGLGGIPSGPNLGGFPSTGFGGYINGIGVPSYEPSVEKQNVFEVIENLSKILGRHSLKAGINFQHIRFYGLQPPDGIGSQQFNGTYTGDPGQPTTVTGSGVADYELDMMNSSSLNTITPLTDLRWYYAAYFQDDWKVSNRLTLNLGLRWEYPEWFRELDNHQANFYGTYKGMNQGTGTYLIPESQRGFPQSPTWLSYLAADNIAIQYTSNDYLMNPQRYNFAPRLGIAYMLDPKTVIRAGAGIFYGGLENIGLGLNLGNNAPFFVSTSFVPTPNVCYNLLGAVTCPTNGQTLETGFGAAATSPQALADAAGVGTIYAQAQNAKPAFTTAYNVTLERAFTNTINFTIGYQGNQSKHLRSSYAANTFPGYVPRGENGQDYQPFHDFYIVNVMDEGIGRYDSLQVKISKQYVHGLYFLGGYTWAHCLDDAFGPIGQSAYGGYRNPNLLGFRYDYGSCTQDVRNRVTVNAQYELPFGAGKRFGNVGGVTNAVIGGWKASLVFQAQTGNPVFLTSSNQGGSYPFRIRDPFATGGTADPATQPQFNCATKTKTLAQWFNPCAFINPPQAVIGPSDPSQNLINVNDAGLLPSGPPGRVSLPGPGYYNLDMSLFKDFSIPIHGLRSVLEFRADAFNILNHPSFGNPGTSLTGATGQAINSTRFSALIPDARVIQVAGRFTF